MICEGTDDPSVAAVPSSWFDGENCWWPPKCKEKKSLKKYIELGYQTDHKKWTSYPAKTRKHYSNTFYIVNLRFFLFFVVYLVTFEEACSHENKAVDNPTEDIETTDNENEKRSRAIRKAKLLFDPSPPPPLIRRNQLQ